MILYYYTRHYSTILCYTVLFYAMLYYIIMHYPCYYTLLCCAILCYTFLYLAILCNPTILYYTTLHYTQEISSTKTNTKRNTDDLSSKRPRNTKNVGNLRHQDPSPRGTPTFFQASDRETQKTSEISGTKAKQQEEHRRFFKQATANQKNLQNLRNLTPVPPWAS